MTRLFGFKIAAMALGLAATTAKADEITIAIVGPMSGPVAAIGEQFKRGAQAGVEAVNAAGGINGKMVKLDVEDDVCDPKQAVAVANRLAGMHVKFVDGHACSGSSIPASGVYAENNILMMTPSSSNPLLTDEAAKNKWSTIMRLYGRDDAQGEFVGPWIAEKYKGKKIVILHDKSAYGQGLATAVKAGLNASGTKEILFDSINPGEKDYGALVSKLKALGAEFVYFAGYHPEAGLIIRQAADQGLAVAPGDVEQRDHDQRAQVRAEVTRDPAHPERGLHVGQHVLVRVHGALGEPGGPAGVENRRDVLGPGALEICASKIIEDQIRFEAE